MTTEQSLVAAIGSCATAITVLWGITQRQHGSMRRKLEKELGQSNQLHRECEADRHSIWKNVGLLVGVLKGSVRAGNDCAERHGVKGGCPLVENIDDTLGMVQSTVNYKLKQSESSKLPPRDEPKTQ